MAQRPVGRWALNNIAWLIFVTVFGKTLSSGAPKLVMRPYEMRTVAYRLP